VTRVPPLYDPRFEHDACGVGFVADVRRRRRDEVLPLALAGLAALGHRGAFGADGESSDGAGIALPLSASVVGLIAPGAANSRPGVVVAFLPRGRAARAVERTRIALELASLDLEVVAWRPVPMQARALGAAAFASRPAVDQAVIRRPVDGRGRPMSDRAFDRRLVLGRRRIERELAAHRASGASGPGAEPAIVSASCRTIVYKGLVAGGRLAELYPDLARPHEVSYAIFHQRYATNTHPVWRLAQPFGAIAHNGEINTVRANREQVRGRAGDATGRGFARRLLEAGPLLSADGSDSLALDEALEILTSTGWSLAEALLALVPEALPLRRQPHPHVATLRRRTAGYLAPWDGPAAIVFGDGRSVGVLVDRNGLRPAAYAITRSGLVVAASEAGAVPLPAAETIRRGRIGPGEMLLVEPGRGAVLEDAEAKARALRRLAIHDQPHASAEDAMDRALPEEPALDGADATRLRYLAGLDAERLRLDVRTMALEGHEPLWSMGDDTPTPGRSRADRRVADHLRQAFAQVTNPAIDPERERVVMDLRVELGPRPALLGGLPGTPTTLALARPIVADLEGLLGSAEAARCWPGRVVRLDARWPAGDGTAGLERALDRLADAAVRAARRGASIVVVSDRGFDLEQLPVPSALAVGAVHTALTSAGLRGRTDVVADAADILDPHALAMVVAVGATAVHPRLAILAARELAGTRAAEAVTTAELTTNLVLAFEAGLRKTLARMGISAVASYVGGALMDAIDLDRSVVERCFPAAAAWPGRVTFVELADRQLRRRDAARAISEPAPGREARVPDPGFARFRSDGEAHAFAPRVAGHIQALVASAMEDPATPIAVRLAAYREGLASDRSDRLAPRDELRIRRRRRPLPLDEVEAGSAIVRRFVISAMSVGALSPEAHQALTIGIQRAGGSANTGEGGEDPAWYLPDGEGRRRDARIKQVASARFGVTSTYLARADQLEIKIAQGSKPGEGGQLPGRKATAYIAALRRGQPGQSYISPPPHHDIYSIEDLAQLIADLRAINPAARIGVKLVAGRGVGTIAAGVAKAGASYIHLSGHAGGTGASPLSSIKHVGAPWELGLAEVHQVLLRNDLRDRIALRVDGGLQAGRDLLVAALLGAEEFAFGTAALVALGCDMARQCHLDTCPTGIATQRDDLREKFSGTPEHVERFVTALAEDLRGELALVGAGSVGEVVGEAARLLVAPPGAEDLGAIVAMPRWPAGSDRRADPGLAALGVRHGPASPLEVRLTRAIHGQEHVDVSGLRITTAERSLGAGLTGAIERGELHGRVRLDLRGAAGQSFGAFAGPRLELRLVGQANDCVAKGLSGGHVAVVPEPDLGAEASGQAIAGNAVLYGATAGRLHLVGRAGMRFAVRNSGADAVVEGVGPHACEYMTGGTIVVLGPIGGNFGAGMTGGRAYLHDPEARELPALEGASLVVSRLAEVLGPAAGRRDGRERLDELLELLRAHRQAGSALAARILGQEASIPSAFWLVEPRPPVPPIGAPARPAGVAVPDPRRPAARGGRHGPVPVNLGPAS
jgi:glutamate synthase domain-containing protein 2/glutamate synthase domain-containing protein 1/glutamate synthase domain-containing protein 3